MEKKPRASVSTTWVKSWWLLLLLLQPLWIRKAELEAELDPDTELHPDIFESAQSNNVVRANAQACPEPGIGRQYRRNAMKKKRFETQVVGRYCMRWQSLLVENLDLLTL